MASTKSLQDDPRIGKLQSLFAKILSGDRPCDKQHTKLFLEAVCSQNNPVRTVERLINSTNGLSALRSALFSDESPKFLNGQATEFLCYIQSPELKLVYAGNFLVSVISCIIDPPVFWNAIVKTHKAALLNDRATQCFAWLLLQLVCLPYDKALEYYPCARDVSIQDSLLNSSQLNIRTLGQKITHITNIVENRDYVTEGSGPGGRHDNDSDDIKKISILPTPDELACTEIPFLRRAIEVENCSHFNRLKVHVDNQFRLLREDMVRELREELQIALGSKKGRRKGLHVDGLHIVGVKCDGKVPWALQLQCSKDLPQMPSTDQQARLRFLKDSHKFLSHQSASLILTDNDVAAVVSIDRDENMLVKSPPIICVRFTAHKSLPNALVSLKTAKSIRLIQLNTAIFSYEPILKQLQSIKWLNLADEIMESTQATSLSSTPASVQAVLSAVEQQSSCELQMILKLPQSTKLDASQAKCFIAGLAQKVSLVQGPPGTGKSFIGALIAKAIYLCTAQKILVICYTHHALDQFLEDLQDVGIPMEDMVRLGSDKKATDRTKPMALSAQKGTAGLGRDHYQFMDNARNTASEEAGYLHDHVSKYLKTALAKELMEHIEFDFENPRFHDAFVLPENIDGMTTVGKRGKAVDKYYLLNRWCRLMDAGVYSAAAAEYPEVWQMTAEDRIKTLTRWKTEILNDRVRVIHDSGMRLDESLAELSTLRKERDRMVIRGKRIIGCTTAAAAKYVDDIQSASPGILLVEEAGEILESHVLTALGAETQQMILIGDHKQLRPKVHYDLSVAKREEGDFNLDVSMFERLVMKGYPHHVLSEQHRMRPEISVLVRQLTYPDLTDAPGTKNRPNLRGFQDNLIFLNHEYLEDSNNGVTDLWDRNDGSSKKNTFEAEMTLKCVRYLGQQGYGTSAIVVLVPYVAQLRLMMDVLGKENDPVLNDLDSHDLVRAGLMPAATAQTQKRRIRISSIDNYQGEQSDIVVISLTRCNQNRNIGFLAAPERLNVLLSRARNAMIMIGNVNTFLENRNAKETWKKLFHLLKEGCHIYDGFPVKCAQHPTRKSLLRRPEDFAKECPDGGCSDPCGATLQCGKHTCPQKCHQVYAHSKMSCSHLIQDKCSKGHKLSWPCHRGRPSMCKTCELEEKNRKRKMEEEFERQRRLQEKQAIHAAQIAKIDEEIRALAEFRSSQQRANEMSDALEQKKRDLEQAQRLAMNQQGVLVHRTSKNQPDQGQPATATKSSHPPRRIEIAVAHAKDDKSQSIPKSSPSELEWSRQKRVENASNDAIDALMAMTGLEKVKSQVLKIKAKIETAQRQGTDLKRERFGIVLLGNPGTGKTTVARLYANFLTSLGILPGSKFIETSGSRLANDGVAGAKKLIETIIQAGGGAFFLDEAYQLALGHSHGGSAVLDFLLAEIENLTGKVCFILAGYNKQMEKFFEHNQGFSSRMPYTLQFMDYSDTELLLMFQRMIEKKYNGRMSIEDGSGGLYARIVVKRLGRGRGHEGFGNARALENIVARIGERQAERLQKARATGANVNDFILTKEDLIGPDPSKALFTSSAWGELQKMIGLTMVKDSIRGLLDNIQTNYHRELQEKSLIEVSLNRVFLGSPGTGKTTVGKLYGQVLKDTGLLSNGEVIVKNPADFLGSALGETEKNTKAILEASKGKVLIIDEAYMLHSSNGAGGNTTDPYKTAAVNTIVAEVQSTPGEDRCVLLLGYRDKLEEMFSNTNPGLARRFPLDDAFQFEDFNDNELREILDLKLKKQDLFATERAKDVAIDVLAKARRGLNFGNGGAVENLLSHAKSHYQRRQMNRPTSARPLDIAFEPEDFDENFKRSENASINCKELFKDVVGCDEVIDKLEGYIKIATTMRARGMEPRDVIPFNFIFKGPPGTGKTTTARKIGQVFYDMGFLASTEVCECSATDLVGQYVGQTGPKTTSQLEKALGKVLFIDEAYRLGEGHFATEAVNELVDNLTKPKFAGKMIVVLAGYSDAMNQLLSVNQGLASRFPEEIIFQNMKPEHCLDLLQKTLRSSGIGLETVSDNPLHFVTLDLFARLSRLRSWGNGRDVINLSKTIRGSVFQNAGSSQKEISVTYKELVIFLTTTLGEKEAREIDNRVNTSQAQKGLRQNARNLFRPPEPQPVLGTSTVTAKPVTKPKSPEPPMAVPSPTPVEIQDQRDPGVSTEVWNHLQADKAAEEQEESRRLREIADSEASARAAAEDLARAAAAEEALLAQKAKDEEEANRLKRLHEQARLERLRVLRAKQAAEAALWKAREEDQQRRKEEARVQEKLRDLGVCVAGFRWIKQPGGYRCGGGSHFIGNAQLGI